MCPHFPRTKGIPSPIPNIMYIYIYENTLSFDCRVPAPYIELLYRCYTLCQLYFSILNQIYVQYKCIKHSNKQLINILKPLVSQPFDYSHTHEVNGQSNEHSFTSSGCIRSKTQPNTFIWYRVFGCMFLDHLWPKLEFYPVLEV